MNKRKQLPSKTRKMSATTNRSSISAKGVYDLTSQIPRGRVSTYGAIARALNSKGGSRAVGQILKRNPTPIVVPCHRVVKSDGSIGGYGGSAGYPKKIELLRSEGVQINGKVVSNLKVVLFSNFNEKQKRNAN